MRNKQSGFTMVELAVVFALLALLLLVITALIWEPIRNARIDGAVQQAKEINSACEIVRVSPATASRDPITRKVSTTYGALYPNWTPVSTLNGRIATANQVPAINPFDLPYYFTMSEKACAVAVDVDVILDGWRGLETEVSGSRTRIVVGVSARKISGPEWLQNQKRILNAETIR